MENYTTIIQLVHSEKFTTAKKSQAKYFLDTFKFTGLEKDNLTDISNKGYFIEKGSIKTIFPQGSKKRDLSFSTL